MRLCWRCHWEPRGARRNVKVCKCGSRAWFWTHDEDGGIPIHRPTSPLQDGLGIEAAKAEEQDSLRLAARLRGNRGLTAARHRRPTRRTS